MNSPTREEALELAKVSSQEAQDLLDKLTAVLAECNKEYPCDTFNLTKAQVKKSQTPNEIFNRVKYHTQKLERLLNHYACIDRHTKAETEKIAEAEKLKQEEDKLSQLKNEAIAFCLKHGESFDGRLTINNAIDLANDIAFDIKVKERELEIGEGYTDFSGKNCYGDCDGWNPFEHRCQCRNRRVNWTTRYGFETFNDMEILAEAY